MYCRPSCAARRANPKNVQFHATAADAERAGFRPCKRCRPAQLTIEQQHASTIARICREIAAAGDSPRLEDLARRAGLSPYHFHRVFKAVTGLTPESLRGSAARAAVSAARLQTAPNVTDAIYDAGFNSGGRFYETSNAILGMKPRNYRAGGTDTEITLRGGGVLARFDPRGAERQGHLRDSPRR